MAAWGSRIWLTCQAVTVAAGRGRSGPYRRRHLVQTAAQIRIDLANHVIAADGHRVPHDYGDAFRVLAEVGVLDDDLAAT